MALIKCSECEQSISNQARVCPHCGYPYNTTGSFSQPYMAEASNLAISELLLKYNVPVYLLGYEYLHCALSLCLEAPIMAHSITTELYPAIAERFQTSSQKVERAIRYALEAAWQSENEDLIRIFALSPSGKKGKRPSNGAFIAIMTKQLQMNMLPKEKGPTSSLVSSV